MGAIKELNFSSPNTKKIFNYLRLLFIKVLIFQHFDWKSHIQIEINASDYGIDGILNQLNIDSNALSNN